LQLPYSTPRILQRSAIPVLPASARRELALADDTLRAQVGELRAAEAERLREHRVGVLAQAREATDGALGGAREVQGVADAEQIALGVGARHLDQHVAQRHVRVGAQVAAVVARARGDALRAELARGLELALVARPRLERGADHRLAVLRPALARPEARVAAPLRVTDGAREPLELVLAKAGDDEVAVARAEGGDEREEARPAHDRRVAHR